jgi:hypothetical protein
MGFLNKQQAPTMRHGSISVQTAVALGESEANAISAYYRVALRASLPEGISIDPEAVRLLKRRGSWMPSGARVPYRLPPLPASPAKGEGHSELREPRQDTSVKDTR